jgi:hypothetical protein
MMATVAVAVMAPREAALAATDQNSPTEFWNEWDIPTLDPQTNTFGPTGIQYVFAGDVTGCFPQQPTDDQTTNPFYAEQTWSGGGGHANPITIVYNPATNQTYVTLSGTMPLNVPPPSSGFPGPTSGNGSTLSYHSGFYGSGPLCPNTIFIQKQWLWQKGNTVQSAAIQVLQAGCLECGFTKENLKSAKAAILYSELADPVTGSALNGTWNWIPYPAPGNGGQTTFTLQNSGTSAVTFGNVGILTGLSVPLEKTCLKTPTCKENKAQLDKLDNQYYPVSGANSPFTPVTELIGTTLQPGQTAEIVVTQP